MENKVLKITYLFNNHLAAIVHEHHPLAQKEKVTLAEIGRYDIALPDPPYPYGGEGGG